MKKILISLFSLIAFTAQAQTFPVNNLTAAGYMTGVGNITTTGGQFIGAGTGLTGTASSLNIGGNAGSVTTIPNLSGVITSSGNVTSTGSQTGTGNTFVMSVSPTLISPALGTPSSGVATNLTGTAAGLTAGSASNVNGSATITSGTAVLSSLTAPVNLLTYNQGSANAATITQKSKNQQVVTPEDFGAIGDGVTDDSVAVGYAFAALNSGSMHVLTLDKMYAVTGSFTLTANGSSLIGTGGLESSGFKQLSASSSTLIVQSTSPTTTKIYDILLRDFSIVNNSATPTSGVALTVNGVGQLNVHNIQILAAFDGILIQGGYVQNWSDTLVIGGNWATAQTGSYGVTITIGQDNGVPSEMAFVDFDWKGQTIGNVNGLINALNIESGDGLFFSNGHIGFANNASLSIEVAASPSYIDAVKFNNVYLDGNYNGSNTSPTSGLVVSGAASRLLNIDFNGVEFRNNTLHGASIDIAGGRFRFNDCSFSDNGSYGLIDINQPNILIENSTFYNDNMSNNSSDAITLTGVVNFKVQGNLIYGNNAGSSGFNFPYGIITDATSNSGIIEGNSFINTGIPMAVGSPHTTTGLNRLGGSAVPTVASAAALPATYLGYDYIQVTGTTAITSIAGSNIEGMQMTLQFTGILTISTGNNIHLASGGNLTTTANTILVLRNDGIVWREVSRSLG